MRLAVIAFGAVVTLGAMATGAATQPLRHGELPRTKTPPLSSLVVPGERLPKTFVPSAYRIRISVEDKLVGGVEIDGAITEPTSIVWLDFTGKVTKAAAHRGAEIVPLTVVVRDGRIALQADEMLAPGPWSLALAFTSKIDDQGEVALPRDGDKRDAIREEMAAARSTASGAFRQTVDGAAYTFTQSEPMDARKIFPCIDEPDRKVPWLLTLDVPAADLAASNAPIASETPLPDGRKRVAFAQTRPLPSYLVAFVVGPFDAIEAGKTAAGVPLRILETRGHKAAWAASTAVALLAQIESWTQIPYAYDKLDLVAVPRTGMHWAAMENAGLITFADWVIRGDDSRAAKKTWVSIASHEFAHQWFGDLVTMAWWDDIWLNESFAVWLAREMTEKFDPAYADSPGQAYFDLVDTARPKPGLSNYQDYFIGGRGARAIAMLVEMLGIERFRTVIHAYLAAHAHGNATTADLAAVMSAAYGQVLEPTVLRMLDSPVMPDVTIRSTCPAIEVMASAPTPVCVSYENDGRRWRVCTLVDGSRSIPVAACPRWVVPNADAAMRYTTHRTPDELAATARAWHLLTSPERAALLAEAGPDLSLALAQVDAPDARAWAAETIAKAAPLAPDRKKLDAWLGKTYGARARALHFDPATREDEAVLGAASLARDPELEREAIAQVANLRTVRTEALGAVVRLALRADPSLELQVLAELDHAFFERRRALLHALPPELLTRDPKTLPTLTAGDRLVILADTCDPARRREAQTVASALSDGVVPILKEFNACLDTRDRAIEIWRQKLK